VVSSSVAFSSSGRLLATANYYDATLSVFSVRWDGSLTPVIGSPLATGEGPNSVAFSPSGLLANTNTLDPSTGQPANSVSVFSYGR
jgi:6-phosphogluconolactonase (cycloisomerase 2 family)